MQYKFVTDNNTDYFHFYSNISAIDFAQGFNNAVEVFDKNEQSIYKQSANKENPTATWIICSDGYYPYCSYCKHEQPSKTLKCECCGRIMKDECD